MKSWSWISPLIMCQDIVSQVISHSWELFILGFLINFLLNHFIYLWRTGLENLFVNFYVFVVQQYRLEQSQVRAGQFSRCEEFLRSREHIDLDLPPTPLWEHQWEQFLTEYYSLTQGGAKIQVRGQTANNKVWPKNLEGQQKQCRIPSWNWFQIFHFFISKLRLQWRGK